MQLAAVNLLYCMVGSCGNGYYVLVCRVGIALEDLIRITAVGL